MKDTLFLLNPKANEETAMHEWRYLQKHFSALPKEPVDMTTIPDLSAYIGEKNPKVVIIAGGDGTINKVVQAVLPLKKQPLLAILPLGFGNALSNCLGVESAVKAMQVIEKRPEKLSIDIFKTTIPEIPVGVFTMGIGFDGQVVHTRMFHRYIGIRSYVLAVARSYFTHVERKLTFTIDHAITMTGVASALILSNAPTIGKNFITSPDAKLNDGFLDGTLFSSHYAYITNLRFRGFKHPLYSEKNKVYFRAHHITISGDQFAQVDGDPAVHVAPIEIEVVPNAVTFLRNINSEILLPTLPFV